VYICLNKNAIEWLSVSYAYKGLLQLVAVLMAFHTRRVKIRALNESKETAVIIYFNSITLALLIVVEFALVKYHTVHAALFGMALLLAPTVFLTLIFIPKVLIMYTHP
jgi:gamma-aminobutyric acid type B receptor